jgi:hypothetical protein
MIFSGLNNFKVVEIIYKMIYFSERSFFQVILFYRIFEIWIWKRIKLILGLAQASTYEQRSFFIYLAKITELSKSYLNEIEKGKKYPKTDKIILWLKS